MGGAPRRRGRQAREQSTRQSTLGKGGESEQRVRVENRLDCGGEEGQRSGGTKGRSTGRGSIRRRPRIGGKALATGDPETLTLQTKRTIRERTRANERKVTFLIEEATEDPANVICGGCVRA